MIRKVQADRKEVCKVHAYENNENPDGTAVLRVPSFSVHVIDAHEILCPALKRHRAARSEGIHGYSVLSTHWASNCAVSVPASAASGCTGSGAVGIEEKSSALRSSGAWQTRSL